jgi:nucleoside-diphosphate-sugar epimerase
MYNQHRNIWIFGGTGFIGRALFSQLSSDLHNRLFLLLHHRTEFQKYESANTFTGSLSDFDPRLFERYPPDVIFHLARFSGSNKLTRAFASQRAFKANQRLLTILTKLNKPPVVVYVSGSLMYGPGVNGNPATELSPLNPVAYAKYYFKGELPWIRAQEKGIIDVRFARPGWIVGPASWFAEFFWNYFLKTGTVPVYGDGKQLMSLVNLLDCARLIDLIGRDNGKRQNLNIFTGPPVSQKEFSEILARKLKTTVTVVPMQNLVRKYGKTVALALTSSIPLSTGYSERIQHFVPEAPDTDSILDGVLRVLKNK